MRALAKDVMAGGNNVDDFKDGGKHRGLYITHFKSFAAELQDADPLLSLVLCSNPYAGL